MGTGSDSLWVGVFLPNNESPIIMRANLFPGMAGVDLGKKTSLIESPDERKYL